jgi:hypothetical protein
MPSMDPTRRRLRLADGHISVLGLLVEKGEIPDELSQAEAELREAGILQDEGTISAELYPLVSTLLEPHVIVRVEVTGPQGTTSSGAVIGDHFVFTHEAWPGEQESEYVPVEPLMLVWALSRMVDLHQDGLEAAAMGEEIVSTMGKLDAVIEGMEAGESADPEAVVAATGAPARLAEVLANLNCMWRMTVAWQGRADELEVAALAVWDCGLEGYWIRDAPAEPVAKGQVDADSELKVRRTNFKELWQMITDLLPNSDQLFVTSPA